MIGNLEQHISESILEEMSELIWKFKQNIEGLYSRDLGGTTMDYTGLTYESITHPWNTVSHILSISVLHGTENLTILGRNQSVILCLTTKELKE